MKKFSLSMIFVFMAIFAVNSQTILFEDNFESYTAGGYLAQQASYPWATWSNMPGTAEDAIISTTQALSPVKSVHIANTINDIILKLGNKTSGKYSIKFNYFIVTGRGAYFNLQHFEAPGIEWAIEVYFGNNGQGLSRVNSINVPFSHPINSWFEIETIVDLDLDSAWLYINSLMVRDWKFSMQSNSPTGTKRLGSVNFYGGAFSGQTPGYYFDDVTYTQLDAGVAPPQVSISTSSITTTGTSNETFTISNIGEQTMSFIVYPIYPGGTKNYVVSGSEQFNSNTDKLSVSEPILSHSAVNFHKSDKANELSYVSGLLLSGLGYGSTVTVRSGVKFDYTFINQYIGRELISVTVGIYDLPTTAPTKVLVYDRGSYITPGPGILLAEKDFTPLMPASEITVNLTTPIYLDGKDIWIGWICEAIGGTYPIGLDEGPKVPGVNFLSVGVGWTEISPTIDNNLYIMGSLQGTSLHQWLNVSPQNGIIYGGGQQNITVSFNIVGMSPGSYFAQIVVGCNDQTQEYSNIDVFLTVGTSVNENKESVYVIVYPNPTSEIFNISANTALQKVELYSSNGSIVKSFNPAFVQNFSFSVSELSPGIYTVVIGTLNERFERKIVIE